MKNQHLTEQDILKIVEINRNNQRGKLNQLRTYADSVGKSVNTFLNMAYKVEKDLAACDLSQPPRKSYVELIYETKKMLVEKGEQFNV